MRTPNLTMLVQSQGPGRKKVQACQGTGMLVFVLAEFKQGLERMPLVSPIVKEQPEKSTTLPETGFRAMPEKLRVQRYLSCDRSGPEKAAASAS